MKKKKQIKRKEQRGKAADDAWGRLMKIREKLGKRGKAAESSEKSGDGVVENLGKIGEELGKGWQSEKSAVEILSEMRR